MIVDVSGINKLMDVWGEDCVCFFNETETTLLNLRNFFEKQRLSLPVEKIKFPYEEILFDDNILIIVKNKYKDDLDIKNFEDIDLDV